MGYWGCLIRWFNEVFVLILQWPTPKSSSLHVKQEDTLGHFRDILLYWPKKPLGCFSLQQSLSFIGFWMRHDGPASRVEKILALKPLCGKRWSSVFIRWRSKSLFRALVSTPVMKILKNDIKSMIGITKSICCFPKWADTMAPDTFFKKISGSRKNWDAWWCHDPIL